MVSSLRPNQLNQTFGNNALHRSGTQMRERYLIAKEAHNQYEDAGEEIASTDTKKFVEFALLH